MNHEQLIQLAALGLVGSGTILLAKATSILTEAKSVYDQIARAVDELRDEVRDLRAEVRELRDCNDRTDEQITLLERRVAVNSAALHIQPVVLEPR